MRLHLDALYTRDANGYLLHVNEPGAKPAPRLFLGRTTDGHLLSVGADAATLAAQARALMEAEPILEPLAPQPRCRDALEGLLACEAPVQRVWTGPAYCIDANSLPNATDAIRVTADTDLLQTFSEWRDEVPFRQPFCVVVENDRAVALCCSVRITTLAHEAGVETLPEHRGRGFAS